MSVLTRPSLEDSPLADLHPPAAARGVEGFRRLRKSDLVQSILEAQPGGAPAEEAGTTDEDAGSRPRRRGGRGRTRDADPDASSDAEEEAPAANADDDDRPARSRRARGGRSRGGDERGGRDEREERAPRGDRAPRASSSSDDSQEEGATVSGVVELLGNGSGFLRVAPPEPSDDDVYISAAQVRRCELVSGDKIAGPVRAPRRSERYPSLIRIDTINDRPADEVAEGTPWDELPAAFPTERFAFGSEDPTLKAIEWLTPIGRGSRVTITGGSRAWNTEALNRLAGALAAQD